MNISIWDSESTYEDLYDPAMEVQTKEQATSYFNKLVQLQVNHGVQPDIASKVIKVNLAYWAAYGDEERRERIERLYECEHPYFGKISENGRPTTDEALQLGMNRAKGEGPQTLSDLRKSNQ